MTLPEIGSIVAVQYKRNPRVHSDPALDPRLYMGRVVRHEASYGFTAALMNYDNVAEETWLEWDLETEAWEDKQFQQPVEWVRYPVEGELLDLFNELEALPAEVEESATGPRSLDEMRLRFLLGATEAGWLGEVSEPVVYYSDDFADPEASVARWQKQALGKNEVSADRVMFEWPIEGKAAEECAIELLRREDGLFAAKSEEFGDEFEARVEERAGYTLVCGLWSSEEFTSFFAAILVRS